MEKTKQEEGCNSLIDGLASLLCMRVCDSDRWYHHSNSRSILVSLSLLFLSLEHPTHTRRNYIIDTMYVCIYII